MEPKRVRHACARCRRQKLRCDNERPCQLCIRANAECHNATERTRRSNRVKLAHSLAPNRPLGHGDTAAYPDSHSLETIEVAYPEDSPRVTTPGSLEPIFETSSQPVLQNAVVGQHEQESAFHLVGKIFRNHRSVSRRETQADAIPDGCSPETIPSWSSVTPVPVIDLIGVDLPPSHVALALLDAYVSSFHWYLLLFHESTLRTQLKQVLDTGRTHPSRKPFLMLVCIVLVIGAKFGDSEELKRRCPQVDLVSLQTQLLEALEKGFLSCMAEAAVEAVSFAFLLACNYLFDRQTKLAFITIGAAVRAAQSLSLHNESSWGQIDHIERQVRRQVWWTVFIGDGFSALSYGRPSMLVDQDCNVHQPLDLDDTSATCPGFNSVEKREDGEYHPVTIHSYHRYKTQLYRIAATITRQIHIRCSTRSLEVITDHIKKIYQKLLEWEKSIPPELKLPSYSGLTVDDQSSPILKIFTIQAMTLQVSYDNVQLFLFRPFLALQRPYHSLPDTYERLNGGTGNCTASIIAAAREQCWISASRTSMIGQHLQILQLMRSSPACVHMGVHSFAAGVMLGLMALAKPASQRGHECKLGISRLVRIARTATLQAPVWSQSAEVFTDLIHLIAAEETKALLTGGVDATNFPNGEEAIRVPEFGMPKDTYPPSAEADGRDLLRLSAYGAGARREDDMQGAGGPAPPPEMLQEEFLGHEQLRDTSQLRNIPGGFQETLTPHSPVAMPSYLGRWQDWVGGIPDGLGDSWLWNEFPLS